MDRQFFASTRGRIVTLLRRASRTVDELAAALDLTDNAVRGHIATLERDRLIEQQGLRRGVSKPAHSYGLTSEAERLFPKAYAAVLGHLLTVLRERLPADALEEILQAVGRRIVAEQSAMPDDFDARLARAVDLLDALGGLAEVERDAEQFVIRGYDCPLARIAADHPDVCTIAAALLTDTVGVPMHERCERGGRPHCRFEGRIATA